MQKSTLLFLLVLLSAAAYHIGRRRSLQVAGGTVRSLHSLPSYYGYYAALWCGIPALLVLFLWTAFENSIVIQLVVSALPEELSSAPPDRIGLLVNDIRNVASGAVAGEIEPAVEAAANHYLRLKDTSNRLLSVSENARYWLSPEPPTLANESAKNIEPGTTWKNR